MPSATIFISYAHVDRVLIDPLIKILRAGDFDPWFDDDLVPGIDWKSQLYAAVSRCDALVYVVTSESMVSEYCLWEVKTAYELRKPIVPVRFQRNVVLPDWLSAIQWIDFTQGFNA